ncbi:hypothetical protein JIN77_10290 [Verrucomicrobiaceae bacterium R5-34]|nr:hypothetical protein [Verrucomicrobiaceae bacterium R5-34]
MNVGKLYLLGVSNVLLVSLISSCGSIGSISNGVDSILTRVVSRPKSFNKKEEKVEISYLSKSYVDRIYPAENLEMGTAGPASFTAGGAIASAAAGYVVDQVIDGAEKSTKNFEATYTVSDLAIVESTWGGFKINRTVNKGHACEMAFAVREKKGAGAYVELCKIDLKRSKAAVSWMTLDNDIDIMVNVKITSHTPAKPNIVILDSSAILVKNVKLGTVRPVPGEATTKRPKTEFFNKPSSGYITISVTVQETADFQKIAERGAGLLEKNKDSWKKKFVDAVAGE